MVIEAANELVVHMHCLVMPNTVLCCGRRVVTVVFVPAEERVENESNPNMGVPRVACIVVCCAMTNIVAIYKY